MKYLNDSITQTGPFDVLLADPAWFYNDRLSGKGRTKFGSGAQGHYPTLKAHEIIDPEITLDINKVVGENAVLFMWVTMPLLFDSRRRKPGWKPTENWKAPHDMGTVLEGWGFNYASNAFTWIKSTKGKRVFTGPGHYTASNTEICIVATRGKGMTPGAWGGKQMTQSVIISPRMEHSRKPDLHNKIDLMYPGAKKLELFARRNESRENWHYWGNEIQNETYDGRDIGQKGVGDLAGGSLLAYPQGQKAGMV